MTTRSIAIAAALVVAHATLPAQDPTSPAVSPLPPVLSPPPAIFEQPASGVAPAPVTDFSRSNVQRPRIRDITTPAGLMPHYLVGVGLVTGLPGSGSSERGTRQAILNLIRDNGLNVAPADVIGGNIALVSLTATLPPFAREGQQIEVKIQSIGDATSLRGGELLRAELRGVDNKAWVSAQGQVNVGGYTAQGQNASVQKNLSTTGWLHAAGVVIRSVDSSYYSESGDLELQLLRPSLANSKSIADGIRRALAGEDLKVEAVDPVIVRLTLPPEQRTPQNAIEMLSRVGDIRVPVENPAKVVIDQLSGTLIAGEGVLISPCVVGLTDVTISIVEDELVSQPGPLSYGETRPVGRTRIEVTTSNSDLKPLAGGATVADLLQNLKSLGLTPSQLVPVFMSLDQGGYLHAPLEVR